MSERSGTRIIAFDKPDVTCLIVIPISGSIIDVPKPATAPSIPQPRAAQNAAIRPNTAPPLRSTPSANDVLPISTAAAKQMMIPRIILPVRGCLNTNLPMIAPIAAFNAAIGVTIDPPSWRPNT